jgi:hypothetical protein
MAFNANGNGRQAYEVRKRLEDLNIDVTLFSETKLKPHMRSYIQNCNIYRTEGEDGHKGETAVAVKKDIRHDMCRPTSSPFNRASGALHIDWNTEKLLATLKYLLR